MKLIPVSLAIFYKYKDEILNVWVQRRSEGGEYHNLLEFPGGKINQDETPLQAVMREVEEEVGFRPSLQSANLMGIYPNQVSSEKLILLNVFLFPVAPGLESRGLWLTIKNETLSSPYLGKIPLPNHQIINDLYISLQRQSLGIS